MYRGVDFAPLNRPGGAKVETPFGSLQVNPCGALTTPACVGNPAATCCFASNQTTPPSIFSCGASHIFTPDLADDNEGFVVGLVTSGGSAQFCGALSASIAFECDKARPPPGQLSFTAQTNCDVNLTWAVSTACAVPKPDRPGHLVGGGKFSMYVMLIIFGGGFAYFGLGTAIKSRMPNASSNFYNNIPNKDFWWHIGDLIKDGLLFTVTLSKHRGGQAGAGAGSDDSVRAARGGLAFSFIG